MTGIEIISLLCNRLVLTFINTDSIVFSGSITPWSTSALSILMRMGAYRRPDYPAPVGKIIPAEGGVFRQWVLWAGDKAYWLGVQHLIIQWQLQCAAASRPTTTSTEPANRSCSNGVITFSSIFRCRVGISVSKCKIAWDTQSVATGEQPIFKLPTSPSCLKRASSYCDRSMSLINRWACCNNNLHLQSDVSLFCAAQKV